MDLQTRKLNLIAYLARLQDEAFFEKIERLILKKQHDSEPEFKPFSVEELLSRIEQSEKDFENGKYKTQAELEKSSENW
jgi:hypothetical protein